MSKEQWLSEQYVAPAKDLVQHIQSSKDELGELIAQARELSAGGDVVRALEALQAAIDLDSPRHLVSVMHTVSLHSASAQAAAAALFEGMKKYLAYARALEDCGHSLFRQALPATAVYE